jgi:hypothetical protein
LEGMKGYERTKSQNLFEKLSTKFPD